MTTRKLEVGDRCIAYASGFTEKGTLKEFSPGGLWVMEVENKTMNHHSSRVYYHPKQLRRLKKRAAKETPERWTGDTRVYEGGNPAKFRKVKIIEIREGERVVSRSDLEKAWEQYTRGFGLNMKQTKPEFETFCTSLGIPPEARIDK